ncbi:hypothetical protein SAMN05216388_1001221 [Halorientalis persicus]|uniref:Uncharacterized protein n=1 Tax=Halorientalis persicus TaxID=1367881 RepID=A0A1H8D9X5_9EURY|nr:hypothetical protein [Halorientalis persicus]SEN03946.1 hypothetical protein SAMN05216388_1001221 [Halorientalis persicus]
MPSPEGESECNESDSLNQYQDALNQVDTDLLIEEYKELGEEVRYRDGLMHNSYYLIAIAIVFFVGNVIDWTDGDIYNIISEFTEFVLLFGSTSGALMMFVAVVLRTYNEKRVRAERRRRDIEKALNMREKDADKNVPLYAVQKDVLNNNLECRNEDSTSSLMLSCLQKIETIGMSHYSLWLFTIGVALVLFAMSILVINVVL